MIDANLPQMAGTKSAVNAATLWYTGIVAWEILIYVNRSVVPKEFYRYLFIKILNPLRKRNDNNILAILRYLFPFITVNVSWYLTEKYHRDSLT